MTNRAAPPVLPLQLRLLGSTWDPRNPRLQRTATVELRLVDLVLLHDGLVVLLAERWMQPHRDAAEALEILARRLGTVLLMYGVR